MSTGHIRQRGASSWQLKFEAPPGADGKRRSRYVTVHGTRTDARRRLRELLVRVDQGVDIQPSKLTILGLVAERLALWRASGRISAKTAERSAELARNQIARIGDIQVQKLTTLSIETWHAGMQAKGLHPRTIRAAHSLLARALDEAVKHALVSRNVARLQRPPRVPHQEVEIVASEQIAPTLKKLDGDRFYTPVVVALYTGLRRGEQLALSWADVDFEARKLRVARALEETRAGIAVRVPKTKAGTRTISLPQVVVDALRAHRKQQLERHLMLGLGKPADDALVFPAPDFGYQSPRSFTTTWSRVVARLGLPPIHWHAWRHTHASMLIAAGVDIAAIAKRLGHASPVVTLSTYTHCFKQDDHAVADAIDALVLR
jgi:integrase